LVQGNHSSAIAVEDFWVCVENLQGMDAAVFQTFNVLVQELITCEDQKCRPLGLILIGHNNTTTVKSIFKHNVISCKCDTHKMYFSGVCGV